MLIAVLSDTHDNIWNVEKVLAKLGDAEVMIFCGDFCAPFTLQMLAEGFSGPVHCVLGNNDGDALLLSHVASQAGNVTLYQGMGKIDVGGKEVGFAHYPMVGEAMARSGMYAAVFSGHTHRAKEQRFGETLLANPGEVMGRYGEPGFGLYDTETGEIEIVKI